MSVATIPSFSATPSVQTAASAASLSWSLTNTQQATVYEIEGDCLLVNGGMEQPPSGSDVAGSWNPYDGGTLIPDLPANSTYLSLSPGTINRADQAGKLLQFTIPAGSPLTSPPAPNANYRYDYTWQAINASVGDTILCWADVRFNPVDGTPLTAGLRASCVYTDGSAQQPFGALNQILTSIVPEANNTWKKVAITYTVPEPPAGKKLAYIAIQFLAGIQFSSGYVTPAGAPATIWVDNVFCYKVASQFPAANTGGSHVLPVSPTTGVQNFVLVAFPAVVGYVGNFTYAAAMAVASVTTAIQRAAVAISSFVATPSVLNSPGSSILNWSAANADTVYFCPQSIPDRVLNGSFGDFVGTSVTNWLQGISQDPSQTYSPGALLFSNSPGKNGRPNGPTFTFQPSLFAPNPTPYANCLVQEIPAYGVEEFILSVDVGLALGTNLPAGVSVVAGLRWRTQYTDGTFGPFFEKFVETSYDLFPQQWFKVSARHIVPADPSRTVTGLQIACHVALKNVSNATFQVLNTNSSVCFSNASAIPITGFSAEPVNGSQSTPFFGNSGLTNYYALWALQSDTGAADVASLSVTTAGTPLAISNSINPLPEITSRTLNYSEPLVATGGFAGPPYTWSSPDLPPGLHLSSAGVITGSIALPLSQTFSFLVTVKEQSNQTASLEFSIPYTYIAIHILTTALLNGREKVPYSDILQADGPATWTILQGGSLPAGVSLDPATGILSGIPLQAGYYDVTFQATDGVTVASRTLELLVLYGFDKLDPHHNVFYRVLNEDGSIALDDNGQPITNDPFPDRGGEQVFGRAVVGFSVGVSDFPAKDIRVRGGGLAPQYQTIEESRNFWDLGYWDGKPYPTSGAPVIYFPLTLLDTYSRDEVLSIVQSKLMLGTIPIIRYYDQTGQESL